ncbi:MAG: DUF1552 domain-containing protein [Myxococcota bacterium]|nr:DUF1552 domain-containing protein [Myxococcota bacterium]
MSKQSKNTTATGFNRRQFLSAMGVAGGSLFLPSLLGRNNAWGNTGNPPKRFVVMSTQHGTWYDGWKMRWPGLPEGSHWTKDLRNVAAAEFSAGLRPLHSFREQLMVVDGLALVSAEADQSGLRHELAYVHALTGGNCELVSGVPLASAPSVDQRIAEVLARPDHFRSVEVGVGEVPLAFFRGKKEYLPTELNVRRTYERLFGLSGDASSTSSERAAEAKSTLLDRVKSRYAMMASRMSGEDKRKLEQHKELVYSLEQQVRGLSQLSCSPGLEAPQSSGSYEEDFQVNVQMMASAFACDLTRVFSFNLGTLPTQNVIPGQVGDIHDDYAHEIYVRQAARDAMTQYTAVHAEHFASILRALASVPEGNGTMLDNTLCLWSVEVADGAHGFDRWPAVLAGGGGNLQMGRYLHYPRTTPYAGWQWDLGTSTSMGVPHQKLLTGVAQSMGVSVDRMPVETIRGINGVTIDCTGTLEGMMG